MVTSQLAARLWVIPSLQAQQSLKSGTGPLLQPGQANAVYCGEAQTMPNLCFESPNASAVQKGCWDGRAPWRAAAELQCRGRVFWCCSGPLIPSVKAFWKHFSSVISWWVPGTRQVGLRLPPPSPWVTAAVHRAHCWLCSPCLPWGTFPGAAQRWGNEKR